MCGPSALGSAPGSGLSWRASRALDFPVFAETTSQLRFDGTTELTRELALDGLDTLLRSAAFRDAFVRTSCFSSGSRPCPAPGSASSAGGRRLASRDRPHGLARSDEHGPLAHHRRSGRGRSSALSALVAITRTQTMVLGRGLARANDAAWAPSTTSFRRRTPLRRRRGSRRRRGATGRRRSSRLGNSLPVRHVDVFCRARPAADVGVWSQRGVSGIDGVVSSAAGAAVRRRARRRSSSGTCPRSTTSAGSPSPATSGHPFVVVVLNNDGGRIFEQLPLAAADLPGDETFWTTPHRRPSFDGLAGVFDVAYERRPGDQSAPARRRSDAGLSRGAAPRSSRSTVPPHGAREQSGSRLGSPSKRRVAVARDAAR